MNGPIVVGVDGSSASGAALRWALREGTTRACAVRVLAAWQLPVSPLGLDPVGYNDYLRGPIADECRASTEVLITAARTLEPGAHAVPVEVELVEGDAVRALTNASKDAALLVVGSRNRHGLQKVMLGSVSAAVVKKAHCPVVVVHVGDDEPSTQELAAARLVTLAM